MTESSINTVKGSSVRELRAFRVLNDHHLARAAGKVKPPPLGSIWIIIRIMNCVQSRNRLTAANMNAQMRRGRRESNIESITPPAMAALKIRAWSQS